MGRNKSRNRSDEKPEPCPHCQKPVRFLTSHLGRCPEFALKQQKSRADKPANKAIDVIESLKGQLKPASTKYRARVSPKSHRQRTWGDFRHAQLDEIAYRRDHPEEIKKNKLKAIPSIPEIDEGQCAKCRRWFSSDVRKHQQNCLVERAVPNALIKAKNKQASQTVKKTCPACGKKKKNVEEHLKHCKQGKQDI